MLLATVDGLNILGLIADNLTIVDLNQNCIDVCKQKFAAFENIEYHVNDGKSLSMIPENSIDFIFSHDSLVHAELDVITLSAYPKCHQS